ncbi:MAG: hypothetical protein HDR01_13310 [Lachnospiraceae bacterium]|nr:hypothetical protein [Lachnospiraceae bacterium]
MFLKKVIFQFIQKKESQKAVIKECIVALDIAMVETEQFLNQDEYLYEFDYSKRKVQLDQLSKDVKRRMSNPVTGFKKIIYGLASIQNQYEEKQEEYDERVKVFSELIKEHNRNYMKRAIADARKVVGNVEGRPLDNKQMECIVKNPRNQLVIAGAGTGKTTTIIGKVNFIGKTIQL